MNNDHAQYSLNLYRPWHPWTSQKQRLGKKEGPAVNGLRQKLRGLEKTRQYLLSRTKQYHRRHLLDDRVRNGYGYGQVPMVTGNVCRLRQ
jgi:hypothetical protein